MTPRAVLRIAGLVGLFLVVGPIHILTKLLFRRSRWPRRFLAAAAWIVGLRVKLVGRPAARHTLLVSNHVSWLDIMILGGFVGSALVSKDELGHGLLHWLADQNDTVYVKRSHRKGAKDQAIALAGALEREQPIAVFPEGTTGPGSHLLPFRSTLLEAANFAAKDVEVRPVAIDYGTARSEVAWFHETGRDNVLRILNRKHALRAEVHLLEPLDRSGDRKRLAAEASVAIARTLGFKLDEQSPIGDVNDSQDFQNQKLRLPDERL
jgi:1-acyl-sn-glycerol-3-phosphate acyltransferase